MHPGISAQHTYTDMRCYTRSLPRAGALCEGRSLAAARAARDDPVVPLEARLARLLWVLFLVKRADRAQVGRQLRRRLPLRLSRRAALHERLEVFVYTRKPLGFHTRVVEAGTQDLREALGSEGFHISEGVSADPLDSCRVEPLQGWLWCGTLRSAPVRCTGTGRVDFVERFTHVLRFPSPAFSLAPISQGFKLARGDRHPSSENSDALRWSQRVNIWEENPHTNKAPTRDTSAL
eukprot:354551-Chlamydomonas_euryale.AAC.21